jgi:hypothetical protein
VVVVWHWVFSVVTWRADGPHAGNPIGSTPGLWLLTWVLQVMPAFFLLGGYANRRSWESTRGTSHRYSRFARKRLSRLVVPTAIVVALALAARTVVLALSPDAAWVDRSLRLLLSPLWFLGVYLVLVLLVPITARLHTRGRELGLLLFVGAAAWTDLLRFHYEVPYVEWLNFVFVYGFAHQLGYWWDDLKALPRRVAVTITLAGVLALSVLTGFGFYPRSMVGVPGDRFSNVAPPTLALLALALVQVGLVLLLRPSVERALERRRSLGRFADWANDNAMSVYLWHFTGYALFAGLLVAAGLSIPSDSTAAWWLQRPLFLLGPALCVAPILVVFRRVERLTT